MDAYAGDGWRGAASQKPKPLGELALAREKIFKGKVKIRELFKGLEFDPNEREITTVEDELGETDAADIFCSKCAMADDREEDDEDKEEVINEDNKDTEDEVDEGL